jgi:hypothetical protein
MTVMVIAGSTTEVARLRMAAPVNVIGNPANVAVHRHAPVVIKNLRTNAIVLAVVFSERFIPFKALLQIQFTLRLTSHPVAPKIAPPEAPREDPMITLVKAPVPAA